MKMSVKLLSLISLFTLALAAQAEEPSNQARSAIGLSAGWIVGNGFLYRHYINDMYVQGTFAGLINKDQGEEYVNATASIGGYLNSRHIKQLGAPVGLLWIGGVDVVYDQHRDAYTSMDISENAVHAGLGLGIEIGQIKQYGLSLSFNMIYTASFNGLSSPEFNALELKPSAALLYNF